MVAAASSRVRIGRFHLNCLVPAGHPAPDRVRTHVTSIVEAAVPRALSSMVATALPEHDASIWFIRHLQLAADVNGAADTRQAAHAIAAAAARALVGEMSTSDGGNVVRFADSAEYLAAFLADLADGVAWERWYFRDFDGLRLLSISAAIRTTVCDHPSTGLAALQHLSRRALNNVVRRLSDADARRILVNVRGDRSDGSLPEQWIDRILDALGSSSGTSSPEKIALRIFTELSRSDDGDAGTATWWCLCLSVLKERLESAPDNERRELIDLLCDADAKTLRPTGALADAEVLRSLQQLSPSTRLRVIEHLTGAKTHAVNADSPNAWNSPFGGALFLLPLIDDLSLRAITEEGTASLRWLVLVKCFGPDRTADAARDPMLRFLAGASLHLSPRELTTLAERQMAPEALPAAVAAENAIRAFAARLPGFSSSSAAYVQENFLDCHVSLESEADRCVARIGAPALNFVLSLAGINRQQYKVSWHGAMRFELYPQSA